MAIDLCPTCGAEIQAPARFCRRCGSTLADYNPSISPSEATTRTFDPPTGHETATQFVDGSTAPAYLAPDEIALPPPAATTKGLASGQRNTIISLLFVLILSFVALIGLGVIVVRSSHSPATDVPGASRQMPPPSGPPQGVAEQPEQPEIPDLPEIPEPPKVPQQPPPPGAALHSVPARSLQYPGSEVTVEVPGHKDDGKLVCHTSDGIDKVVNWYLSKLKGAQPIRVAGGTAIISTDTAVVVMTNSGDGTQIVVTKGKLAK
ncbi:MAG TPA: zinc ribbon domain-containing protein [Blastocatellia bacterium]|nr:zinc ribbon domain-containing protein [Blastocatellia bacterium]